MLSKSQKSKQNAGFTIIEVMIVLAIAGLIMLIVFLAVPALQRNSRNTQNKNDASAIASAINEYESNNNGALPTTISGTGNITVGGTGTGVVSAAAKINGSTTAATSTTTPTAAALDGKVLVRLKYNCNTGATSARATSVYYLIESSTNAVGCISN